MNVFNDFGYRIYVMIFLEFYNLTPQITEYHYLLGNEKWRFNTTLGFFRRPFFQYVSE